MLDNDDCSVEVKSNVQAYAVFSGHSVKASGHHESVSSCPLSACLSSPSAVKQSKKGEKDKKRR